MDVINVESNRLPAMALYIVVAGDLITGNGSDYGWKKIGWGWCSGSRDGRKYF